MSMETAAPPMTIEEFRRAHRPEIALYNASDDPVNVSYSSIPYKWAPNSTGPSNADGSVGVQDRVTWQRGKRGKLILDEPPVLDSGKDGRGAYAHEIAENLYRRYGHLGLVPVYGDGRDDERIAIARKRWIVHKLEVCRAIEHNHEQRVARTHRPGMLPPPMPKKVRDAISFRSKYERDATDRARWIARNGAIESEDRQTVVAYIQQHFPAQWAAEGESMILDRDTIIGRAPSVAPTQPVQEQEKVPEQDAAWIIDEAERLGIDLTRSELKGILRRDVATIENIAGKLAKKQAAESSEAPA